MISKISRLGFEKITDLIRGGKAGVVLCCTMNEVMMAEEDIGVRDAMSRADILTPDGMPLVWYQKWKWGRGERVYGPDLMREFITFDTKNDGKMLFIGDENNKKYFEQYGKYLLLPYKNYFTEDDYLSVAKIIKSERVKIVWLGLGARKQVLMADGLKRYGVNVPIVTVGAAFDFLSGQKTQAPRWMRSLGLEWLFRVTTEPRRLWPRYWAIIAFASRKVLRH